MGPASVHSRACLQRVLQEQAAAFPTTDTVISNLPVACPSVCGCGGSSGSSVSSLCHQTELPMWPQPTERGRHCTHGWVGPAWLWSRLSPCTSVAPVSVKNPVSPSAGLPPQSYISFCFPGAFPEDARHWYMQVYAQPTARPPWEGHVLECRLQSCLLSGCCRHTLRVRSRVHSIACVMDGLRLTRRLQEKRPLRRARLVSAGRPSPAYRCG